jgi:hypothetical protein
LDRIEVGLDFSQFPDKYTCMGDDSSPRLSIKGAKGSSMALIMDDPDAPSGTYVHWVMWNMRPMDLIIENIPREARMVSPFAARQGKNTARKTGYMGPCPPKGRPHRYYFKIYVLDTELQLPDGAEKKELEKAMEGHIIQYGEAMATYGR